ncbi:MAG: transposase DNA-binding-containing protein [Bacteroidales bacterium]|jgi:hypothetical protein|nr:transposase DNA-binding-containing protein [Bacteroidales bacterium]
MIQNKLDEYFSEMFKDKRIDKRANLFLSSLIKSGSAVVNQNCSSHKEKIASYRMLNNKQCGEDELRKALYASCNKNIEGEHLFCIQDTLFILTEKQFLEYVGKPPIDQALELAKLFSQME